MEMEENDRNIFILPFSFTLNNSATLGVYVSKFNVKNCWIPLQLYVATQRYIALPLR